MRTVPLRFLAFAATVVIAASASAETKPATTKPAPAKSAPAAAAAQPAGSPLLLLESKDWKAITATGAKGKICFALTEPQKMDPPTLNHGKVYVFLTTRPGDNVRNEPMFQVGYPMKDGSKVTLDVDGRKFQMFTRGDSAWLENNVEPASFVEALKKGKKLTAGATSGRGNPTNYAFSLTGLSGALEAVAKECK
jgi:invasion protein IalB